MRIQMKDAIAEAWKVSTACGENAYWAGQNKDKKGAKEWQAKADEWAVTARNLEHLANNQPHLCRDKGPRLFSGIYPCGIVYADRHREVNGDYKRAGFLSYATLELKIEEDCPAELAEEIRKDAAVLQAKRGQEYEISTCGQTVILGGR